MAKTSETTDSAQDGPTKARVDYGNVTAGHAIAEATAKKEVA